MAEIELTDVFADEVAETEAEVEQPFCIDSDERVEWLLGKIGDIEHRIQAITRNAADMIAQLNADRERLENRFKGELEQYVAQKLADGKSKTARFLLGSCSFRTVPAALRIVDPALAMDHASAVWPHLITEVPKLDTDAYRARARIVLRDSGELMPGVEVVPERQSFSIKVGTDG